MEVNFEQHGWVPFDPNPRPVSPFASDIGYASATAGPQLMLRAQVGDIVQGSTIAFSTGLTSLFGGRGMAALVRGLGSGALSIVIRFRRWRWTRTRRSRGYTQLTGGGRERVMNVSHKSLRTLENKGYPRRQPHQASGDYLAHLKAAAVYLPCPSVTLAVGPTPPSTTLVRRTFSLRWPTALSSSRYVNCSALAGESAHPHRAAAFPSRARWYEPQSG